MNHNSQTGEIEARAALLAQLDRSGILQAAAHQALIDQVISEFDGDRRRMAEELIALRGKG